MCEWEEQDPHCHVDPVTRLGNANFKGLSICQYVKEHQEHGRPVKSKKWIARYRWTMS